MSQSEFYFSVRLLRERYNNLVAQIPKTTDKAFEEARAKIKAGRHEPDFEVKQASYAKKGEDSTR